MRIELPATPWSDTVNRADDDAHTLTVAAPAQPAAEWLGGFWAVEPGPTLRVAVPAGEPAVLTITL